MSGKLNFLTFTKVINNFNLIYKIVFVVYVHVAAATWLQSHLQSHLQMNQQVTTTQVNSNAVDIN